jgi:hypothetical protein
MYSLIETTKLNKLDPEAYLRNVRPHPRSTVSPNCCHGIGSPPRQLAKQAKGPSPSGYFPTWIAA